MTTTATWLEASHTVDVTPYLRRLVYSVRVADRAKVGRLAGVSGGLTEWLDAIARGTASSKLPPEFAQTGMDVLILPYERFGKDAGFVLVFEDSFADERVVFENPILAEWNAPATSQQG